MNNIVQSLVGNQHKINFQRTSCKLHKLLIDYIIRNFSDLRAIQTKKDEFEYFLKVNPFVTVLRNPSSTLQKVRVATYAFIQSTSKMFIH